MESPERAIVSMALMVIQFSADCWLQHEEGSERARDPEMVRHYPNLAALSSPALIESAGMWEGNHASVICGNATAEM
jgi:hypothetical protein